jgi:hypothetical protein
MTLIRLICSGAAAISTLGLISCSAEKSQTDDFRISPPVLQMTDAQGSKTALSLALDKVLPAEADLVFPSLEATDFTKNPVEMTTHSTCTVNSPADSAPAAPFEQVRHFQNASRLPLLVLLPHSFMLRPENEKSNYTCTFNFSAKDKYASVHNFTFTNVRIASIEQTATLKLQGPTADVPLTQKLIVTQDSLYQTNFSLPDTSLPIQVFLECAHYHNEKTYDDLKQFNLSDLALAAPEESGPDLRTRYWQQRCRLVTVPKGRADKMEMSRVFEIQFMPPNLTYKMMDRTSTSNRKAFADLAITNKSGAKQLIALDTPSITVSYTLYMQGSGDGSPAVPYGSPQVNCIGWSLSVQTALAKKAIGKLTWYEIPAHSSVTLSLVSTGDLFRDHYRDGTQTQASTNGPITVLRSGQFNSLDELSGVTTVPVDNNDTIDRFTFGVGNNP